MMDIGHIFFTQETSTPLEKQGFGQGIARA